MGVELESGFQVGYTVDCGDCGHEHSMQMYMNFDQDMFRKWFSLDQYSDFISMSDLACLDLASPAELESA